MIGMGRSEPARIDKSLYKMIEELRVDTIKKTGLNVSFSQASRILAQNITNNRCKKKLNKKEMRLLDL